jgi:hypothetical protein
MLSDSPRTLCKRLLLPCLGMLCLAVYFTFCTRPAGAQDAQVNSNSAQPNAQKSQTEAKGFRLKPVSLLFHRWKAQRITEFNFSLEKNQRDSLAELKVTDLEVTLDGQSIKLGSDALKTTGQRQIKNMLLIDGSLSMVNVRNGFNKIEAAKYALHAFIDNLRKDDQAIIYRFDAQVHPVLDVLTSDKGSLHTAIGVFYPDRNSADAYLTNLYGGLTEALTIAESQGIHTLIIFSDGMQDFAGTPEYETLEFDQFKTQQEQDIAATARRKGVRIFAIPIGDMNSEPKTSKNNNYVDADTLKKIAEADPSGLSIYIDFPTLRGEAEETGQSPQSLLERDLAAALEKVRQASLYSYTVDIPLSALPQDGRQHELVISTRGSESQPKLSVTYPLMWALGDAVPLPKPPIEAVAVFFRVPKKNVPISQLAVVYVSIIGLLAMLSLAPTVVGKVQHAAKVRAQLSALNTSVLRLEPRSPYIGEHCPNEESVTLKAGDVVVRCPKCQRLHHLDCWEYSMFRCMERHCSGELPIPETVLQKYQA